MCHLGSLCSVDEETGGMGRNLNHAFPLWAVKSGGGERADLAQLHPYQSFLFTFKKQVYSNVVLSSYMGQNSSGTLLEENHRKEAVWIASRALQISDLIRSTEGTLEKAWAPYSISEKLTDSAPVSKEPVQAHCQQQYSAQESKSPRPPFTAPQSGIRKWVSHRDSFNDYLDF